MIIFDESMLIQGSPFAKESGRRIHPRIDIGPVVKIELPTVVFFRVPPFNILVSSGHPAVQIRVEC